MSARPTIAGALCAVLADPPARAAVRAYAERFAWGPTTAGQIRLFRSILDRFRLIHAHCRSVKRRCSQPQGPRQCRRPRSAYGQNRSARARGPLKLLHAFPTFAVGGAQTRFAVIANALGQGFEHVVVSGDGNHDGAALVERHVPLRLRPIVWRKGSGLSLGNLPDLPRRPARRTAGSPGDLQLGRDRMGDG